MLGNYTLRKPLQVSAAKSGLSGRGWGAVGASVGQMSRESVSSDGGDKEKLCAADYHCLYHRHEQ